MSASSPNIRSLEGSTLLEGWMGGWDFFLMQKCGRWGLGGGGVAPWACLESENILEKNK